MPDPSSAPKSLDTKEMLWAIVSVWIVGMFSALIAFHTFRTGINPNNIAYAQQCGIGYGVIGILALVGSRMILWRLWSRQACIIISSLTALMFVGVSVNIAGYLSVPGSTWVNPGLAPWSDAWVRYQSAMDLWNGWPLSDKPAVGYQLFLMFCFNTFGRGILAPLLANVLCMSLSVALVGCICHRLCPGGDAIKRVWVGMLLFAIIPGIAYYGTLLQREAIIVCALSCFTLLLTDIYQGRLRINSLVAGSAGAFMLMPIRHLTGYLLMVCALTCFIHSFVKHTGTFSGRANSTLAALLLCFAIVAGGRTMNTLGDTALLDTAQAARNNKAMFGYGSIEKVAQDAGNYYSKSIPDRLAYLPVAAVAQYFPPFPWNYTRDRNIARFVPIAHLSILWYFVGGLVLGYFALCIYRKRVAGGLQIWALMWLMCYLSVAFMSAGTVARYYLPFMPLCIPPALQTIISCRHGLVSGRDVKIYAIAYIVAVAMALVVAYNYLKM
ncbi:MAG: hypothetical protein NC217_06320 [Muribaculaceae bacterium]|nr:hypothetical protein [Muribaculaceae bacterium]